MPKYFVQCFITTVKWEEGTVDWNNLLLGNSYFNYLLGVTGVSNPI